MRGISAFLLLHFLAVTFAPAWVVADFLLERSRIERELCVQRMVPDAQRTCHGGCYLMKQLKESSTHEKNLPAELRALRMGDMVSGADALVLFIPQLTEKPAWGILTEEARAGHPRPLAPVPWC